MLPIITKGSPSYKILRNKAIPFPFINYNRSKIKELLSEMRATMKKAQGIGLAANQVGYDFSLFIAQIPGRVGDPKFYAIFNPKIIAHSNNKVSMEEGCLSVPMTYGSINRFESITLQGLDLNQKVVKIKAWGLLARVFQHEVDHLNGKLFIDNASNIHILEIEKTS